MSYTTANNLVAFISPIYKDCSSSNCDGTYNNPYDSIMYALQTNCNTINNECANVTLILISDSSADHYFLGGEFHPDGTQYYNYTGDTLNSLKTHQTSKNFTNINCYDSESNCFYGVEQLTFNNLIITGMICSEYDNITYPDCINDNEYINLYLKTTLFSFIINNELIIKNIILDGSEDLYFLNIINQPNQNQPNIIQLTYQSFQNLDFCLYNRIRCCNQYDLINGLSINSLSNDVSCIRKDIQYPAIIYYASTTTPFMSFKYADLSDSSFNSIWVIQSSQFLQQNLSLSDYGIAYYNVSIQNINITYCSMNVFLSGIMVTCNDCTIINSINKFDTDIASSIYSPLMNLIFNVSMSLEIDNSLFSTDNLYNIVNFLSADKSGSFVKFENVSVTCISTNYNQSELNTNFLSISNATNITIINSSFIEIITAIFILDSK